MEIMRSRCIPTPLYCFMERKSGIYKITNAINDKVYIGQSVNLHRRKSEHFAALARGTSHNQHLQRAYDLYGADQFHFEVIEYCEPEVLDEKEIYYISLYRADTLGYNIGPGGKDSLGHSLRRAILSRTWECNKRRVVLCNTGEVIPSATDAANLYGIAGSTITSCCLHDRFSAGKGADGSPLVWMYYDEWVEADPAEVKNRVRAAKIGKGKPVICLNTLAVYNSAHDASRETGVDRKSLVACCRGKIRCAGADLDTGAKLVWMYHDDYMALPDCEREARRDTAISKWYNYRAKPVMCLNNGVIFPSATEAGKYAGVNWSSIAACCAGKVVRAGVDPITREKLRWSYVAHCTS